MLEKLNKHIAQNFPFLKEKKLLIAISGGLDSVVLTQLLSQLKFDISLAHCNFKLRENESDLDEKFVADLGKKLDKPVHTISFDTNKHASENKLSTQIAARELRYNWFAKLCSEKGFDYLLTAHHADDNLETFLINLSRGTGLEGLTGIPAINNNIIRPLLPFSRADILQYAKENTIEWREDASNASTKYVRNKLRHDVVPALKEINPTLLSSFSKTIEYLQESQQLINDAVLNVKQQVVSEENNIIKIDIKKTEELSNPKAYLYQILKEYNFTEWNDVNNLLSAQTGKQIFSKTHQLLKNRDFLLLSEIKKNTDKEAQFYIEEHQTEITNPIHLTLTKSLESTKENNVIFVDKTLLTFPLIVRKWKNGDYFYPSGMTGKKKVSKYFKDEKISLLEKENIWLLCNANNDIIWILNKRQDNRFLASKNTENIIKIKTN